jgi:type I restriction enzyme M protein
MNLAIHGLGGEVRYTDAGSLLDDAYPSLKADFVMANPPFNQKEWATPAILDDARWRNGTPPEGNANYAWIQHFIHHLAYPNGKGGGVAGFVMANGSLSSNTGGEGDIRRKIVEADLVDCIVTLPAQLFFTTGIPVCLWFLTRDKTGRNIRRGTPNRPSGREGETLFIDARKLGTMQTRVLRVLTGTEDAECVPSTGDPLPTSDVGRIVYTYRRWRGEPAPEWWNEAEHGPWAFAPTPGFAKAATMDEIAKHGHVLTPGRYVGTEEQADDAEPFADKYSRLVAELEDELAEGERLAAVVRASLSGVTDE